MKHQRFLLIVLLLGIAWSRSIRTPINSKRIPLIALLLSLAAVPVAAQDGTGRIVFDSTQHTFPRMFEGAVATHTFAFRNEGNAPLLVTEVRPSCGCTTPEWTRDPIAPGATGEISVGYDSNGRPGPFRKSIYVYTDGEPDHAILYIQGHVRRKDISGGFMQGKMLFEEEVVDVGYVAQGSAARHLFRLQNKADGPIRIESVRTSRDNVYAHAPQKPILQDDMIVLEVVVDTGELEPGQRFDYAIILTTDDAEYPSKSVRIKGMIAPGS